MSNLNANQTLADLLTEMEEGGLDKATPELQEISREIQALSHSLRLAVQSIPFGEEPELSSILDQAMQLTRLPTLDRTVLDAQRQHDVRATSHRQLGHYDLLEELGAGGMGTIYRARHQKLNRTVALKVLPSDRFQSSDMVERFEREMRAVGMLQHPHIVAAHDAGEVNGCHYLVMELVEGLDLGKLVGRLGPIPIADACEIIRQAALGLQHIADHGLVHRDIKPSNLMLARSSSKPNEASVKILDLGLALLEPSQSGTAREITATGQVMGTIDYMSPEQGLGTHLVDIRADLYSLGATLYKLLVGRAPLQDPRNTTMLQRIRALEQQTPPPANSLRTDCPAELSELIERLLSKAPTDRPERPDAIVSTLARFATGADLNDLLTRAMETVSPTSQKVPETTIPPSRTVVSASMNTYQSLPPGRNHNDEGPRGPWLTWAAAAAGLPILIFAAIVLFFQTSSGTVRVESNDPNIKIAFENEELKVVGAYAEPMTLKPGPQGLRVQRGDFEFETKELKVSRGDRVTLRIDVLPGKIEIVQVGKGVLDSRELTGPPQPGTAPVATKSLPPNPEKPFTLVRGEQPLRNFATAAGALAEARDDDVIEVHGNGAYLMNLPSVVNKPLRLRAAPGQRPRLIFRMPLDVHGQLSFEGLDIDSRKTRLDCAGDRMEFVNCRVLAGGIYFGGKTFEVRDSVLLIKQSIARFGPKNQEFRMENCLYHGQMGVFSIDETAESVRIHLVHNTIYQEVADGGGLIAGSTKPQIHVHAEGNIFHYHGQRGFIEMPDWLSVFGKSLHWSGKNNLYANLWAPGDDGQWRPAKIDDWNKLIGHEEPGSQVVPQVELQFVRLMDAPMDELRPELSRILKEARLRNNLPDLGPDLALVGPGDGYLEWLDHEQRTPAELRPEIETGGPCVLLSAGKPPVGFGSLQEAEKNAVDGDTIEIRQDGACGPLDLKHEAGRLLTIRGAAGYKPVVAYLRNFGNDRLILENLVFEANFEGAPWDAEKKVFLGQGGVHRISHCQFSAQTGWIMSPFIPLGDVMPVINHSRLTLLHYGVDAKVRLQLKDSVLVGMHSGRDAGRSGAIELDYCLFWNPEPRWAYRQLSFGVAAVLTNNEQWTVKNTYLSGAGALFRPSPTVNWQAIDFWHGDNNLHAAPSYLWGSPLFQDLGDWQAAVKEEPNSREDFPPLADPRLWNLIATPSEGDPAVKPAAFGADPSRIAPSIR